jgi:class 3 adenylate cyclase
MTKAITLAPEAQDFMALLHQGTRLLRSLAPEEKVTLEFDLYPSVLQIKDRNRFEQIIFLATEAPTDTVQVVPIILENDEMRVERHVVGSFELQFDVKRSIKKGGQLAVGKVQIELENRMNLPVPIWILVTAFESWDMHFGPFLNGKKLLTTQTFRDLFRSETVQTSEGIGVKDITFLFTDLKGSTAMYDAIGDPKAYYLVRQHFDALGKVVAQNNGAIVKTIGDAIMATFMTPHDAVKASIEMLKEIDEFNRSISQNLYLKVGIHHGHSIAVTLNERLDYFGQTVNIAARVQGLADADEIYVTQEVYNNLGQSESLIDCHVTPEQVAVKGVSDKLNVYKITL